MRSGLGVKGRAGPRLYTRFIGFTMSISAIARETGHDRKTLMGRPQLEGGVQGSEGVLDLGQRATAHRRVFSRKGGVGGLKEAASVGRASDQGAGPANGLVPVNSPGCPASPAAVSAAPGQSRSAWAGLRREPSPSPTR